MLSANIRKQLQSIVGKERYIEKEEELQSLSYDAYIVKSKPSVVIYPLSTQEISQIAAIANKENIPVTARGAGTNMSGGSVPVKNGILLCMTKMNRIMEINTNDRYAVLQPGVVNGSLQNKLAEFNFFYPPDPASFSVCTIGGNVSENSGGPRCLKYGVTADYILGLEVVLASGEVIRTGSKNIKDVTGYNLTGLFCGSEGTLGIITEIILKIIPLPQSYRTILAIYNDLDSTAKTVTDIIGAGIVPSAIELMDKNVINVVEDNAQVGLPREAAGALLIEVDGIDDIIEKEMRQIVKRAKNNGAVEIKEANNKEEREELWKARRSAYGVYARLAPNCISEDATVPVSKIPDMIRGIANIAGKYQINIGIMAHAGDGNMHPMISFDPRNQDEWQNIRKAVEEIFELAVSYGGTLSGEHGIGISKSKFLPLVIDKATLKLMSTIKKAIDPKGILNPGKFI